MITGVLEDDALKHVTPIVEQEVLRVNEWRVARDGLAARVIDFGLAAGNEPVVTSIRRLIDRVARSAEALGDAALLAHVDTILQRGSAADRMRRHFGDAGTLRDVVSWLVQETLVGTGLDRRAAQRSGS